MLESGRQGRERDAGSVGRVRISWGGPISGFIQDASRVQLVFEDTGPLRSGFWNSFHCGKPLNICKSRESSIINP